MVIGGLAGAAVVVALMMHVLHPLFAKPGSLHVTSNPPQATVHIDGQKDLVTPADFPQLKPGKYQVAVTIPGYDPSRKTWRSKMALRSLFPRFNSSVPLVT